jgi:hypothetical protein
MSFGPNLDILRIFQPNCGIMQAQINDDAPIAFFSRESSAAKYPSRDALFKGGIIIAEHARENFDFPADPLPGYVASIRAAPARASPIHGRWYSSAMQQVNCAAPPCAPMSWIDEVTIDETTVRAKTRNSDKTHDITNHVHNNGVHTFSTIDGNFIVKEIGASAVDVSGPNISGRFHRNLGIARANTIEYDNRGEIIRPGEKFATRMSNTIESPFALTDANRSCAPPVLPLVPGRGSAAAVTAREISTLS